MILLLRILIALPLLAISLFCIFGVLASFEPRGGSPQYEWMIGYAVVGLLCVAGAAVALFIPLKGAGRQ